MSSNLVRPPNLPAWLQNKEVLHPPTKTLRAAVIRDYVRESDYPGVVVFTCGNAANALRRELSYFSTKKTVVEIGPKGPLDARRWFSPAEIHATWPHLFDATSGHLPYPLMVSLSYCLREWLATPGLMPSTPEIWVPTGSGETIICLQMAFPRAKFRAVYDDSYAPIAFEARAPLTPLVADMFPVTRY